MIWVLAARLSALTRQNRPQLRKACAWQANALIRRAAMLSTAANPTDGRFDGDASASPQDFVHP
jgi:hypothetical protein